MDNNGDSAITLSSNQVGVFQGRQAAILAKIGAVVQAASSDISLDRSTVGFLKQEYNEIVEKLDELDRSPLVDPLEVLPADIWPNIFEELLSYYINPIEELLNLTLVSRAWLVALTSFAELWTKIWLDLSKGDYLARALVAIHLSRTREIELYFGVMTLDEWRKISSMITPESGRIRYLSFRDADIVRPVDLEILRDLNDLPVLRELLLHEGAGRGSDSLDYLRDEEMERTPSLKGVEGIQFNEGSPWNRFIRSCWLTVETIQPQMFNSFASSSTLKILTVTEYGEYEAEKEIHQSNSFSPIDSVEKFTYEGQNLLRSLKWVGDGLTTLSFTSQPHTDIGVVLLAISRFRRLQQLSIRNKPVLATLALKGASNVAAFELSVKGILLIGHGREDTQAAWDGIFRALMTCSSRLETLAIGWITLTEPVLTYIATRRQLISLQICFCQIDMPISHMSLDATTIRHIRWQGADDDTDVFFALFHNHAVRTLELGSYFLFRTEALRNDRDLQDPEPKRYGLRHGFPNVTSLIITGMEPAIWGLQSFHKLKELEIDHLRGGPPASWGSDVLDAILIRPIDAPALEKITIGGVFYEWDILILMLERRNFLADPGVAPIKTIVLDRKLPYKLLYPISQLLGGKFVERDSNSSFSIEAIGQRLLNKSRTGCNTCCFTFTECESQLIPGAGYKQFHVESTHFTRDYLLPSEYMIADPPLPLEMEQWLSRKRARREAFERVYEEAVNQLHRKPCCAESMHQRRDFAIDKYSLAGVLFEQKDTLASDEA